MGSHDSEHESGGLRMENFSVYGLSCRQQVCEKVRPLFVIELYRRPKQQAATVGIDDLHFKMVKRTIKFRISITFVMELCEFYRWTGKKFA